MKIIFVASICMFLMIENAALQSLAAGEHHKECAKGAAPGPEKLVALIGWPYSLDCSLFFESDDYYLYDLYDNYGFDSEEETLLCEIYDGNGNLLLNSSTSFDALSYNSGDGSKVILPDVQRTDNVNFTVAVKIPTIDKCVTMEIQLQLRELEEQTCENHVSEYQMQPVKSTLNTPKIFSCKVPSGVYPKEPSSIDNSEMQFSWKHNCGDLPEGVFMNSDNSTLTIPSLTFEHGGTFSCSVTYKRMTRNLFSTSLCVQHGLPIVQPIMTCQKEEYLQYPGEDVTVRCLSNFGSGVISPNTFSFRWTHTMENDTNVIFCRKHTALQEIMTSKSSCTYKLPEEACFVSPPSDFDRLPKPALVDVFLTIRELTSSDFGVYQSILNVNVIGSKPVVTNILINRKTREQEPEIPLPPAGLTSGEIVGISVGAAATCLLLISLVFVWFQFSDNRSSAFRNEKIEEDKDDDKV